MSRELDKINDYELLMLYRENDEDAKNLLFLKYKFIIDVLIKKYKKVISACNIDYQELYSECTVGFCDGLNSYSDDKNTTLSTFITLCIDRRLRGVLRKYNTEKNKMLWNTYSLDYYYDDFKKPLIDILTDESNEPLLNITKEEDYNELLKDVKKNLSMNEEIVFDLMLIGLDAKEIAHLTNQTVKQCNNSIQRVKNKIKKYLVVTE